MRFDFIGYLIGGMLLLGLSACQQHNKEQLTEGTAPMTASVATVVNKTDPVVKQSGNTSKTISPRQIAAERAAAARIVPQRPGLRVSRVQAPGMYVALTFDDGPSSAYTPKILDILKRHGARATFFVLGSNVGRYPSVVKRAADEGHEIGVHTWSHINMARSSMAKIDKEVGSCVEKIRAVTGKSPVVMRPPYGATTGAIVNHMYNTYGMRSILWDVDTRDWQRPGVSTVVRRAVDQAKPGSIILVHDIHASTLSAVEGIVTGLQARGFQLVTVSELMARAGVKSTPQVEEPGEAQQPGAASVGTPEPVSEPAVTDAPAVLPAETTAPTESPAVQPAPAQETEPDMSAQPTYETELTEAA